MTAAEYLALPCPHNAPDVVIRSDCWECFRDAVTELSDLRETLAAVTAERDSLLQEAIDALRGAKP